MKNNNKGFSLVELIVVIAIMAILAAVAVIGVSVYIPKAQQASDKQMVADIEYVLNLHAQSTPDEVTAGYIVLSPTANAQASSDFAIKVLKATYGEDWESELKLAYSEWADEGVLEYVLQNGADSKIAADSNYLKYCSPSELVDSIGTLADSLATMAETASGDPLVTMTNLGVLTEDQASSIRGELAALNLSWDSSTGADNSKYSTALSNLLITNVSNELSSDGASGTEISGVAEMAKMYAVIYGWAATDPAGETALINLNNVITDTDSTAEDIVNAFEAIDATDGSPFAQYVDSGAADKDQDSLQVIMGAVSDITADYDITKSGLFSAESIGEQVNNYVSAVSMVSALDPEQISVLQNNLTDGAVVIFHSDDGKFFVMPTAVRFAE